MDHLWQAGVFATQRVYKERYIKDELGSNCIIGGRISDEDWER